MASVRTPRVSIEFCTACKWNLRAAWLAQELLSTFGSALGEVAMAPAPVAGTFTITVLLATNSTPVVVWDRHANGGFPDSKDLKRLVRDVISPGRDLGHVDRPHGAAVAEAPAEAQAEASTAPADSTCVDCAPNVSEKLS
ncbi:Rdx family-domain-containing protein [Limtongia smithiae]|uniref:Rdx family-domain-containing protein n=1 Tax=Limtongia smithiae TaxID=1125753 RepID=UPI0034CE5AEC